MNKQSFSDFIRVVGVVVVTGALFVVIYFFVIKDAPTMPGGNADSNILERLTPKTAVSIVLVLIGLLAWMFWLTISFGRRLSERSYLGPLTRDALVRAEINRREDDLREDLRTGAFADEININDEKFLMKHGIPQGEKPPILRPGVSLNEYGNPIFVESNPEGWGFSWEEDSLKKALKKETVTQLEKRILDIKDKSDLDMQKRDSLSVGQTKKLIQEEIDRRFAEGFMREQLEIYYRKRAELRKSAREYADRLLPGIDVSAFGGGWIFVLEFTTIIFIIFAAIALGFVGVLGSEQIGTILAAIAGYVLGKSTSMKSPEGAEIVRGAEQPTAVMDLLAKQSENRAKTDDEKKALAEKITQLEKELSNAKIIVPDLRKKTFADAEKELKEKGLLASRKDVITDSDEPGLVFEQVPAGKEELAKGSMVVVLVASKKDAQENLQSSPPTPPVPLSPPPEEQQANEPQKDKDKVETEDQFDEDRDSDMEGPADPV